MLPLVIALSSSDGVAVRYVLPVLRMFLCFHTIGIIGQNQQTLCFEVRQVAVQVLRQATTGFGQVHQSGEVCCLRLVDLFFFYSPRYRCKLPDR